MANPKAFLSNLQKRVVWLELEVASYNYNPISSNLLQLGNSMMDDQDLGFFANFLGIFIFVLVIAYHYVMADPKYEGN
ncbi:unnamed protein product [Prunus armeniaca]|nr:unnamed protein product [Prunus armeniaca]CAB4314889.1 unnamed protein product [Prunus armeniaca]